MWKSLSLVLITLLLGLQACSEDTTRPKVTVLSMNWDQVRAEELPEAVRVFEGTDEELPLKAWMAIIDLNSPDIDIEILSSLDADGRQTPEDFARDSGACLLVNGGYFLQRENVYSHVGLLISNGDMIQFATPGIFRDDLRYDVHRAAIGFDDTNMAEIGWVSSLGDSVFIWEDPIDNRPKQPGSLLSQSKGHHWVVEHAVSGGPALLVNGQNRITVDEEVFFGTIVSDVHPRTAAGIGKNGELFLLVVDGRQRASRGVSLTELAGIMKSFGVEDALNLDGGGSAAMLIRNELMNRPAGGTSQREIVSAIAVHCKN